MCKEKDFSWGILSFASLLSGHNLGQDVRVDHRDAWMSRPERLVPAGTSERENGQIPLSGHLSLSRWLSTRRSHVPWSANLCQCTRDSGIWDDVRQTRLLHQASNTESATKASSHETTIPQIHRELPAVTVPDQLSISQPTRKPSTLLIHHLQQTTVPEHRQHLQPTDTQWHILRGGATTRRRNTRTRPGPRGHHEEREELQEFNTRISHPSNKGANTATAVGSID